MLVLNLSEYTAYDRFHGNGPYGGILIKEERSYQIEANKFITLQIVFATQTVLQIGEYVNNSLHLARKYSRIFVRGNYLFRVANSFPRA